MNTRFYNARILTMQGTPELISGELWVEGDTITHLGQTKPTSSLTVPKWDREINLNGNLLLPGFKNAHTHSAMTFLRSHADDLPLLDWLNNQVFPMEAKLQGDDVYHLTRLAILEYLSSGITACFDMYFFPELTVRASSEMGFRTVLCSPFNSFYSSPEALEQMYLDFNGKDPLISCILGFHAEYTCSKELLIELASIAQRHKAPVFTHLSESRSEVAGCIERHGTTPAVFLDSLGIFEYGGGGYHCVHLTEQDMQVFKQKKLSVVSNPGSNSKLASGIAPLVELDGRGINLALGTDGPASNNALDMFREMYLATVLQKIKYDNASAMNASRVLQMATIGSATAMGLTDSDVLAVGKKADLIVIDMQQPNMQPENNIVKNLVYSGSKQNIELTMIAGKILYENGEFFVGEKPEEIYKKASEIVQRICS